MPEETEEQQQESNTEIRITVKEEEEELVNSKGINLGKINNNTPPSLSSSISLLSSEDRASGGPE